MILTYLRTLKLSRKVRNSYTKSSIKFLLLSLFLWYYGCITLFNHTHIINGVTIVHSHPTSPFGDTKGNGHSHTSTQIVLISELSNFLTTAIVISSLLADYGLGKGVVVDLERNLQLSKRLNIFEINKRGPPVFSL